MCMRKKISRAASGVCFIAFTLFLNANIISCKKNKASLSLPVDVEQVELSQKNHSWYYFSNDIGGGDFHKTDSIKNVLPVDFKPWTETLRISSAASVPVRSSDSPFQGYAILNRAGILAFTASDIKLFSDATIFLQDTAESLVFSNGIPVFYLYRSTFFNEHLEGDKLGVLSSRPFLVEFNPSSRVCFPLVSYGTLNLESDAQICGYFWDGETWACAAKRQEGEKVDFTYFFWEPLIPLTDLSPALDSSLFVFRTSNEKEYTDLSMPKLFTEAPTELRTLLKAIPEEFPLYVSWRDRSGTSPFSYYQPGNGSAPLNAHAGLAPLSDFSVAVFQDGTTYAGDIYGKNVVAFRLPRLPAGFVYGDFAVAGKTLYVAWEETNFYLTGRSGFLSVNLEEILK